MSGGTRALRVAERVREVLMSALLRGAVRDGGATGVTITDVRVSKDLRQAKVYIRLLLHEPGDAEKKQAVRAMTRATGLLRRELGAALRTKFTPELHFYWDDAVDRGQRVQEVLHEISVEQRDGDEGDD